MAPQTVAQITAELYDAQPATPLARAAALLGPRITAQALTLTDAWQRAVQAEAAKTQAAMPALWERCEAATALIFAGKVALFTDGTADVSSRTDPTLTYKINGHCGCADAKHGAPDGLCAHRLAVGFARRASRPGTPGPAPVVRPGTPAHPDDDRRTCTQCRPMAPCRSHQRERDQAQDTPLPQENDSMSENPKPPQTPATVPAVSPAPCPEAMFTATLRGLSGGLDAMFTARGQTWDEFQTNLAQIRALFDAPPTTPPPSAPAAAAQPTPEGWCLVHQTQMKKSTNERGSWWSHKAIDGGWCKGK